VSPPLSRAGKARFFDKKVYVYLALKLFKGLIGEML